MLREEVHCEDFLVFTAEDLSALLLVVHVHQRDPEIRIGDVILSIDSPLDVGVHSDLASRSEHEGLHPLRLSLDELLEFITGLRLCAKQGLLPNVDREELTV